MMRLCLLLLTAVLFSACATAQKGKMAKGKHITVRTTAYTAFEPGGSKGANGERLRFGGGYYSAASDWSWMPLGTRFRMLQNDRTYVIEDYGSALVGRETVDLFMPSTAAMREWGCRHVEIEILEWGSEAMSLKLLEPRAKHPHVARMVAALRAKGYKPLGEPKFAQQ